MADPLERIKARWAAEGIAIRPGNPPEALAAFKAKYGVALPPALRRYFAAVDGTGDDSDDALLRFWPLAEVMPATEYWPSEPPEHAAWFFFADFMINSHVFAVRLTSDPADGGPIESWDGDRVEQAPSFAAFLDRYLADRESLGFLLDPTGRASTTRDDEADPA